MNACNDTSDAEDELRYQRGDESEANVLLGVIKPAQLLQIESMSHEQGSRAGRRVGYWGQ